MVDLMATKSFQWMGYVDDYVDYYYNSRNRINSMTAQEVIDYLEEDNTNEANIILSSGGGDMFAAQKIIGLMEPYKSRISVEIVGLVASAATAIAVAIGEKKYVRQTSMVMVHAPTSFTYGTLQAHRNKVDMMERTQDVHENIFLENTELESSEIRANLENERYYTAQECIDKGIADELLEANEKVAEVMEKLKEDIDDDDDIFIIAAKYPMDRVAALYKNNTLNSITTEVNVDKELEKSLRAEIDALKDKVTSLEQSNTDLKAKLADKIKELNAQVNSAVVDKAISEKRIDAKERDTWLNRLNDSPKVVKEILESMEPAVLHSGEVGADKDKPNSDVSLEDVPEGIISSYKEAGFSDEEILKAWRDSQ